MTDDCSHGLDPLRLVREGTSQDGRAPAALDPASAPVDARTLAHDVVFAQGYAALLNFFNADDAVAGDWRAFFETDVTAVLAAAAVEDIDVYKRNTREWLDFLNDLRNQGKVDELRDRFSWLYAAVGTLALGLDALKESLPAEVALKGTLRSNIQAQLAPALDRLIAYYKAGDHLGLLGGHPAPESVHVLRRPIGKFQQVFTAKLSGDWSGGGPWEEHARDIPPDASVYGPQSTSQFDQINHCTTHTLFRSVFDQFLKAYVGSVSGARQALQTTLSDWSSHPPHYALLLAFLQLFEYPRASANKLTGRHLDFYFRTILGLKERPAEPARVHLLAELARQAATRDFPVGELFKGGKDSQGKDVFFANVADMVANKASVAALSSLRRHAAGAAASGNLDHGRLFAAPVANSADGLGGPITSSDPSWHPFLGTIDATPPQVPPAQVGFALASHHLLMGEGPRDVIVDVQVSNYGAARTQLKDDVRCLLTTAEGWVEKPALTFVHDKGELRLLISLSGADPAVTPYSAKVHGYNFRTELPMLLVQLSQERSRPSVYSKLQALVVTGIRLKVEAKRVKALSLANDFGPVDPSKPFQPFGSTPTTGSSLIVGSNEIFQKTLVSAKIEVDWLVKPAPYETKPEVAVEILSEGAWSDTGVKMSVGDKAIDIGAVVNKAVHNAPNFAPDEAYDTASRQGFLRLKLTDGFGQDAYQRALISWIIAKLPPEKHPGTPPVGPTAGELTMGYSSSQTLALDTASKAAFDARSAQFFHLGPFGTAEQHPCLTGGSNVPLLPQFGFERDSTPRTSEAELYIGVAGLVPRQDLSLLFQVADGTANPRADKPKPHIAWSYLANNRWVELDKSAVRDTTGELLKSGVVVVSIPRAATSDNSLMPGGLHWIRAAVSERSDAVCRLRLVAAQALEAVLVDRGNAPDLAATPLPSGTVAKLAAPDASVKSIAQPFASFGGRGAEAARAFHTRVSERLRHKDRSIQLWDLEHLVLEAFPQIHKVKCLNHTRFEPDDAGKGIYRELAAGHVTVITIPNLEGQQQPDPLKPYTSLRVLQDIEAFLKRRTSCFVQLHVKNPQFEEVRVRFSLRLFDGYDEQHYTELLKQTITRFLSPWAFSGGGAPSFGGKIYKSVLIDLVEQQPYVDYVTDFMMFRDLPDKAGTLDLDEVSSSTAVSLLVSAPASAHAITVIKPAQDGALAEMCGCNA